MAADAAGAGRLGPFPFACQIMAVCKVKDMELPFLVSGQIMAADAGSLTSRCLAKCKLV